MSPEGLLLTSMDEDALWAVPLALGVGSHIGLPVIRPLNNFPAPIQPPWAGAPCLNIVCHVLGSLVLINNFFYPYVFRRVGKNSQRGNVVHGDSAPQPTSRPASTA